MQVIACSIAIVVPVVARLAATAIFGALLLVTALLQVIHAFKVGASPPSAWYALGEDRLEHRALERVDGSKQDRGHYPDA